MPSKKPVSQVQEIPAQAVAGAPSTIPPEGREAPTPQPVAGSKPVKKRTPVPAVAPSVASFPSQDVTTTGEVLQSGAGLLSSGKKKTRNRTNPGSFQFCVFNGTKSPKFFGNTQEEVLAFIQNMKPGQQGRVSIYRIVQAKVKTSIEF